MCTEERESRKILMSRRNTSSVSPKRTVLSMRVWKRLVCQREVLGGFTGADQEEVELCAEAKTGNGGQKFIWGRIDLSIE